MAISLQNGWTAASLLPSLAAGFSSGGTWPKSSPVLTSSNPNSLKNAVPANALPKGIQKLTQQQPQQATEAKAFRDYLTQKIMGSPILGAPPRQPNANLAVNSMALPNDAKLMASLGIIGV